MGCSLHAEWTVWPLMSRAALPLEANLRADQEAVPDSRLQRHISLVNVIVLLVLVLLVLAAEGSGVNISSRLDQEPDALQPLLLLAVSVFCVHRHSQRCPFVKEAEGWEVEEGVDLNTPRP